MDISVGSSQVRIRSIMSPITPDYECVGEPGTILKPGERTWMYPSQGPIIIAVGGTHMIIAHGYAGVIKHLVQLLQVGGARLANIEISIFEHPSEEMSENDYIEEAIRVGVRYAWKASLVDCGLHDTIITVERPN